MAKGPSIVLYVLAGLAAFLIVIGLIAGGRFAYYQHLQNAPGFVATTVPMTTPFVYQIKCNQPLNVFILLGNGVRGDVPESVTATVTGSQAVTVGRVMRSGGFSNEGISVLLAPLPGPGTYDLQVNDSANAGGPGTALTLYLESVILKSDLWYLGHGLMTVLFLGSGIFLALVVGGVAWWAKARPPARVWEGE